MPTLLHQPNTRASASARPLPPAPMPTTASDAGPALSDLSPEELARRVQGGSSACFAELVGRFEGRLFNFLLRRVPASADAEDLTQDTFVRAWQRIDTYDPSRRFSTWLFTIAARLASSHRRTFARDSRRRAGANSAAEAPDPARHAGQREHSGRVWELVDEALNSDQRSAIWLRYVEDMPITEIARVLGKSSVAVRVALFRARRALADRLDPDAAGRASGGQA
jgi:RNA polymerase sigma factor (sigma-70 family)